MSRWPRVGLPALGWFLLFAAFYGAWAALVSWLEARLGARQEDLRRPLLGMLVLGAGGYAAGRVFGFHPLFLPDYRAWLATTPWTSRKPLPFGPVHLAGQDVVFIALLLLLAWLGGDGLAVYVPQVFLAVYLALLGVTLFSTGCRPWGYGVGFGLGLAVGLWRTPAACLGVELLTYAVAYLGLRRSLARFPWGEECVRPAGGTLGMGASAQRVAARQVGWPFRRLAPRTYEAPVRVPPHQAVLTGLLVGWWVFVAFSLAPDDPDRRKLLHLVLSGVIFFAVVIRLAVYCDGCAAPVSLLGRLATGRLIIPGYDQVFVAPLLAVAVGAALGGLPAVLGIDPLFSHPVAVAAVLMTVLGVGPGLVAWQLTGEHRITEGTRGADAVRVG